jgi:hypothetical protein
MTSAQPPGRRKPNRLAKAASPYLRQHAYNPIDWHEWGEEAFDKARSENKPIFVSVGYSTCHWCHVMERESFENEGIAAILNASFVPIKVDRERHPDVDETYMLATQLVTGQGGWPNSVFLTPERKPFYAGTYFPPDAFRGLLSQVASYWDGQEPALRADADRLAESIQSVMTRRVEAREITPQMLNAMAGALLRGFDPVRGGFGGAPKFPQEALLLFLLRLAEKDGHADALHAVSATLEAMLDGGIHDHAGGGFHRYSVDAEWLVPHFEKMLYNQALIVLALLRVFRLTGNGRFADGARRALDYVLDDLTDSRGGFYAARDADSEGEEGTFYVWTPAQIGKALGKEDAAFACAAFGVGEQGNFEHGASVLHYPEPPQQLAGRLGMKLDAFAARVGEVRAKLAKVRAKREPPIRDEKILAAWNGMMIAAFAEAAETLGDKRYGKAAVRAANFIWTEMQDGGRLKRAWFEGDVSLDAQQEDYAFAALGFIALYDATARHVWLERAETLMSTMVRDFRDDAAGDFFMTASLSTFSRAKARTDGGMPSGNAAALEAFARLAQRSACPGHRVNGEALLAAQSGLAVQSPHANAWFLMAADNLLRGGAGSRQFLAGGAVDARASLDRTRNEIAVTLAIAEGWHVNANAPSHDTFAPAKLSVDGIDDVKVTWPKPVKRKLGFHGKELPVYEGAVKIRARLGAAPAGAMTVRLGLQACSHELCLEFEEADLRISANCSNGRAG